jgi:hypothetical protein
MPLTITDSAIQLDIMELTTSQQEETKEHLKENESPSKSNEQKIILTNPNDKNVSTEPEMTEINGWTIKNQSYFQICIQRLKYYRIINNFFFFELKKREGRLSWAIIVLSSFSSVLSLINTDTHLFPELIKWSLVFITLIITLISAYIKKQQFIERINDIDRYLQKLNQTVEDLDITFIMEPEKRESYDKFCEKYIPLIKNLCLSPASFSPSEWKRTVYIITKFYPELTRGTGEHNELIWPWYTSVDKGTLNRISNNKKREETDFGKTVIKSFSFHDKIKANMLRV